MKGIISDPTTAVDPSTYDTVLDFVARHCIGVLYDETVKSFCILGDDQAKLVNRKEQPLTKPSPAIFYLTKLSGPVWEKLMYYSTIYQSPRLQLCDDYHVYHTFILLCCVLLTFSELIFLLS